jgi:hypothetical protein
MGESKPAGGLSQTAITYLKEWYAGDNEEIFSKYLNKGNECENEAIQEVGYYFGIFDVAKNTETFENEYMTGTPDLIADNVVFDTKCSWNHKTFLDSVYNPINADYYAQLQGYMKLTGLSHAELCYVLIEYEGQDFSHIERDDKFYSIPVNFDVTFIEKVEKKVIQCREWLEDYNAEIKLKLKKS